MMMMVTILHSLTFTIWIVLLTKTAKGLPEDLSSFLPQTNITQSVKSKFVQQVRLLKG